MSLKLLFLIIFSVSMSAIAQIVIKMGMSGQDIQRHVVTEQGIVQTLIAALTNVHVLAGLACYITSMLAWLFVLAGTEVSKAYPFVGLGFIFTMLLGWVLLDEGLSSGRVMGTLLVVAGVVLVARS